MDAAQALRMVVEKATSQSEFSRETGISQQRLSYILKRGNVLPAEFVIPAEAAFGVSRHLLRPDIYPQESGAVAFNRQTEMKGPNA